MVFLQGEYADNEYIISSVNDAIPVEVGKSYIMFLTDRYLETEGKYGEMGREYLFEYTNGRIYRGKSMTVNEKNFDQTLSEIKAQISLRTGRADEVGWNQYMFELGERQRAEYEQAEAERAAAEKITE